MRSKGMNKTTMDWLLNMSEEDFAQYVLWLEKARYTVQQAKAKPDVSKVTSTEVVKWTATSLKEYVHTCAYAENEARLYKDGLVVELRIDGKLITAKYITGE